MLLHAHVHAPLHAVNKTQDTNLRHQAPSATVLDFDLSSSSCPYAESQPGQLLAVINCSDSGDPMGASLNASILIVLKEEVMQFGTRTILVPSSDADIVVQRDHNSPSHFYLLLEHVNFVPPETTQEVAPTYEAYVQCTNDVSMVTQPVTFCIKHSKLVAGLTECSTFPYTPATPYFTNIPREFHIFTNPPATHRQHFFNVRVGVWNAKVRSFSITTRNGVCVFAEASYILNVWDTEAQVYSVSGEPPNFEIYTILITGECITIVSLPAELANAGHCKCIHAWLPNIEKTQAVLQCVRLHDICALH